MKRIVLHLGTHKTGTSFIQATLRQNGASLEQAGIRPVVGGESNELLTHDEPERVVNAWIEDRASTILYSNENFVLAENEPRLNRARAIRDAATAAGADVTTLFFIRPAVEWIPSMWAQYVKIASPRFGDLTFDDFVHSFPYESILESIQALGTEAPTVLRPYVRSPTMNQQLLHELFAVAGASDLAGRMIHAQLGTNITPSRRQTELALLYNRHRPPGAEARANHVELLNSFLRTATPTDDSPGVAATVTKEQFQYLAHRYSDAEAALTNGAVDSSRLLADLLPGAPDAYAPDTPAEAVDLYLQHMMILSKIG